MRRIILAIGRGLEKIANSDVFLWLFIIASTIGFTALIAELLVVEFAINITLTWLIAIICVAFVMAYILTMIVDLILVTISCLIEWYV